MFTLSNMLHYYVFYSEYLEASVELYNVVQATFTGAFIGACMGGFVRSREAYLYFIENNQATIFTSTMEAKVIFSMNALV